MAHSYGDLIAGSASAAGGMRHDPPAMAASPLVQHRLTWSMKRHLLQLPAEQLLTVLSFLPAPDVARSCATSKAFQTIAEAPALWRLLYASDFDPSPLDAAMLLSHPKACYARRLQARQRRVALISDHRRTEAANEVARRGGDCLFLGINAFNVFTFVCAPTLLLLVFTAILAAQLDGVVAWSWARVLTPIILLSSLICAAAIVAAIVLACIRRREGSTTSPWARIDVDRLLWAPTMLVIRGIVTVPTRVARARPVFFAHFALFLLALLFVPILLAVKLDVGGFSWAIALIPTWIAIAAYCCAGCCGWLTVARERSGAVAVYITSLAAFVLPLLIVLILVVISLDGIKAISLQLAFIPWWILLGGILLPLCIGVCVAVAKGVRDRDASDVINALAGILFSCTLLIPPTVTLVLLTLRVQGVGFYAGMTWGRVFAPIMFLLALLMLVTCIVSTSACVRQWRMIRRREAQSGGAVAPASGAVDGGSV